MDQPQILNPLARASQAEIEAAFVDTKYICDALSMHVPSVNTLMTRKGKACVRVAGKIAWRRHEADEVIAKVKEERARDAARGYPVGWK